jgi:arginase
VAVIGAPLAHGQPLAGVDRGPDILRSRDLLPKLKQDGWIVEDTGDLNFGPMPDKESKEGFLGGFPNVKFAKAVGNATDKLAQATAKHSAQGDFCLTLGGDHSIAIGSIAGILQTAPSTGIIWVDAHADLNSPDTSASGNIHGMVLSYLFNLNNTRDMPGFEWMKRIPILRENRLVYIGLRDVDDPEKILIRDLGIKTFTMQDVDRWGIGRVMEMAIDHVCPRTSAPRPLHLSFDIDSVDPTYAPSTGTRVAGGLTYR